MATLTLTIDPAILEVAKREAERRQITLDQLVAEGLLTVAPRDTGQKHDNSNLLRLMEQGVLGDLGQLPTREEIYSECTTWPRS
jgi:hypothetical protein